MGAPSPPPPEIAGQALQRARIIMLYRMECFGAVCTKEHMQVGVRDACCCGPNHFITTIHAPMYLFQEEFQETHS